MSTTTPTAKPWYKSKIILLAAAAVLVYGSSLLITFLSGAGVTPEQIQVIADTQPDIADAIQQYKDGQNILSVTLGVLFPAIIAVVRRWWTNIPLLK